MKRTKKSAYFTLTRIWVEKVKFLGYEFPATYTLTIFLDEILKSYEGLLLC